MYLHFRVTASRFACIEPPVRHGLHVGYDPFADQSCQSCRR